VDYENVKWEGKNVVYACKALIGQVKKWIEQLNVRWCTHGQPMQTTPAKLLAILRNPPVVFP
jgi:hypothetical protein